MKFKTTKIEDGRAKPWQVSWIINKKRNRRFFKSRDIALEFAKEQKRKFAETGSSGILTPEEVLEYREAKRIAGGVSLVEVARKWVQTNLVDVSMPLSEARALFLAQHLNDSYQYRSQLRNITRIICESHPDYAAAEVRTEDIDDLVGGLPFVAETKMNYRRVLNTFFEYCLVNKWILENPVVSSRKYRIRRETPDYLSLGEIEALLKKARELDPELETPIALQAFFGIRTYEVCRLRDSAINRKDRKIYIGPEVGKPSAGRDRPRLIEGLPCAAWKRIEKPLKPLGIESYIQRRAALRKAAEVRWFNSALRSTFISHAVTFLGGADKTALISGHDQTSTIHAHYRGLVSEEEATAYFA